jgi:hypothetical protein
MTCCGIVRDPAIKNDSGAILRSGKRFVVHADEKLTAFLELESVIASTNTRKSPSAANER